jgi:oleate hydratase
LKPVTDKGRISRKISADRALYIVLIKAFDRTGSIEMFEQDFENRLRPDAHTPHLHHNGHSEHEIRKPQETNAYLVGSGIASLAAAAHLIHDAHVPADQIHILESSAVPGGSMDGAGTSDAGYIIRGGRMLNFSYLCTYDLLQKIPSLTNPSKSVQQEIHEFNAVSGNKTYAHARLVARGAAGPEILDVETLGLDAKERVDLMRVAAETENQLGCRKIDECFEEGFFDTKFWYMWATM